MKYSLNQQVACVPPERTSVEATVSNGFATSKPKSTLTALKVLFAFSDDQSVSFEPGDTVHVKGEAAAAAGKLVYELEGARFVLIRLVDIVLAEDRE